MVRLWTLKDFIVKRTLRRWSFFVFSDSSASEETETLGMSVYLRVTYNCDSYKLYDNSIPRLKTEPPPTISIALSDKY